MLPISTNASAITHPASGSLRDYLSLMKPRVMALVVFTSFCGLILAPGHIHPFIAFTAILCITLGAGSSAAINMWYDRDIDAIMERTKKRPIVTGNIAPEDALAFGVVLGFLSILLMALCVNYLSAFLLALTIFYYIFIYTLWLKRSTMQNIVIGGAAGALPPMIGWSAVTSSISLESLSLFLIIFLWTPPHSWALALFRTNDYKNCNVPMMPVVRGELYTKIQIFIYSMLMIAASFAPFVLKIVTISYVFIAAVLGSIFLLMSYNLFFDKEHQNAKRLFGYSILYLFAMFLSLLIFHGY